MKYCRIYGIGPQRDTDFMEWAGIQLSMISALASLPDISYIEYEYVFNICDGYLHLVTQLTIPDMLRNSSHDITG